MKIVKLKGGLGNQMFQYAFAKMLEEMSGEEVKLDYLYYQFTGDDNVRVPRVAQFKLKLSEAKNEEINKICLFQHSGKPLSFLYKVLVYLEDVINKNYFRERTRAYIKPEKICKYTYFDGYWQSYKYVERVKESVLTEFIPKADISEQTQSMIKIVTAQNSVFIGVRKGDYSVKPSHYGSFGKEYYLRAMKYIAERVDNPIFYIFSNDIAWCKENLDFEEYNVIYREPEEQVSDFEELILMSSCKHAIIVNSTYHWWGAYLNKNRDKIVCCPKKWFFDNKPIDIIPPEWVQIDEERTIESEK